MRKSFRIGRSLVLMATVAFGLSGCLGDDCRPHRGWDRGDNHRGYDHCDRDRDRHHRHYY